MTISFPKSSHQSGFRLMLRNPHPKKERHGDCGTRAICLALGLDYKTVWQFATNRKQETIHTLKLQLHGDYLEEILWIL